MAEPARKRMTLEEFLAWEETQPEKWEFIDGEVSLRDGEPSCMTGGTPAHSALAANMIVALSSALKGRGCRIFTADMRVETPLGDNLYPDVSVRCAGGLPDGPLTDPVAVVEVLSPSSERDDFGRKRFAFQTIPSLRHYILVAQDRPRIEVFSRHTDGWLAQVAEGMAAALALDALSVSLSLADIYEDILPDERATSR